MKTIKDYGYNLISNSRLKRKGGGLAIVLKNDITMLQCKKVSKYPTYESAEYVLKSKDICIRFVNVYRPPYSKLHPFTVNDFLKDFENHLTQLQQNSTAIVLAGDINIHLEQNTTLSKGFLYCLNEFSYHIISDYNFTHNHGGILDFMAVSEDLLNSCGQVHTHINVDSISDHFPVSMVIKTGSCMLTHYKPDVTQKYRNFSMLKESDFKDDLYFSGLLECDNFNTLNGTYEDFSLVLRNLTDKHCPLISKSVRSTHKKNKWFDSEIRALQRK